MESPILGNINDFLSSLPTSSWGGEENLYQFKGFWFRLPYLVETLQVLNNFKPLCNDVILASFPKTGTTWLKSILFSIIHRSSRDSLKVKNPHDLIPTLEVQSFFSGAGASSEFSFRTDPTTGSSMFCTHIPYQILADNLNSSHCKVVYITREPKDTLISWWHFVNRVPAFQESPFPLERAVEQFCKGIVPYGPYYDHVLGYHKQSLERPEKVFFITYEEMMEDPKAHVKRLAQFLGRPFEEGDDGEKMMDEIISSCSFETLSNHEVNKSNGLPINFVLPFDSFFRRGRVGDHANFLEPEMIQRIDAITQEKFQAASFSYVI